MRIYRSQYRNQYKSQYRKKKRKKALPAVLAAAAAALLLLFGRDERLGGELAREVGQTCYRDVLEFFMPGVCFGGEKTDGTVAEEVLSHFFLLAEEETEQTDYPTQVESELSYEAILAREAQDENYVDEKTGEVVFAGESGTGLSGDENAQASGETAAAQAEGMAQAEDAAQTAAGVAGQTDLLSGAGDGKVVSYPREKLNDFDYLIQNFYQVDSTTTIDGSQLNADALLGKDMRLTHDASTPQILIYHTHSQEGYADSVPGDPSMSVVGVGDYLTKLLTEKYGFNVIHHTGEYDVGDRDHAYSKAAPALEQVLAENPSIEVVIDLHRDGVAEGTRLVTTQNGKEMAQVMFFNGLSRTTSTGDIDYLYNPYIEDNLAISFQMQLKAAEYYPDFTRRIYLKGYRYNMHYCPKTLLIEVGAQTNTLQEAMNSMEPLADILNKVLTGQQ